MTINILTEYLKKVMNYYIRNAHISLQGWLIYISITSSLLL